MRVRVFLYTLNYQMFVNMIDANFPKMIANTQRLLLESGIDEQLSAETLECINEAFQKVPNCGTGMNELLHAICWFLKANCQATEIEALCGWKFRFFEQLALSQLPSSPCPPWLPTTDAAAPQAILMRHSNGDIDRSIRTLQHDDTGNEYGEEFQEARDELIDVLEAVNAANEDVILVSLL